MKYMCATGTKISVVYNVPYKCFSNAEEILIF